MTVHEVHWHVHYGVDRADSTPDVHIITPLDDCARKHRAYMSEILFSTLQKNCLAYFYGRAGDYHID